MHITLGGVNYGFCVGGMICRDCPFDVDGIGLFCVMLN